MRLTRSSLLLAFPLFLSALSLACGGKVVVDAPVGSGGAGGTGGASQSSSSSVNTSSSFVSSSSFVATSSSFVSSSSFVATSTGSGTMTVCDQTGNCQDGPGSCVQCAVQDPCLNEASLCQSDAECMPFIDCANNCSNDACQQACTDKFPKGAQLYQGLIVCVVCKACPVDCQQFTMGFCP